MLTSSRRGRPLQSLREMRCAELSVSSCIPRRAVPWLPLVSSRAGCGIMNMWTTWQKRCTLTSVSTAPGQIELTRTGARSTASPRASASTEPTTPTRRPQFFGGFTRAVPDKCEYSSYRIRGWWRRLTYRERDRTVRPDLCLLCGDRGSPEPGVKRV